MTKVEVVKCKKCSNNIGTLTETGILSTIPENTTTVLKHGNSRLSDAWFGSSHVPPENVVALCTSCISVDTVIQTYIEKHSTGHTQSTLLQLIVTSNLIASRNSTTSEHILDIAALDNGGIIFDYSKYRRCKTTRSRTSYRNSSTQ